MPTRQLTPRRRRVLEAAAALSVCALAGPRRAHSAGNGHPQRGWFLQAERMRQLAESWGDQSYGAVLVADGRVIGFGPSRVVKDNDPDAHAERVAIREALRSASRAQVAGAVLYSTSRPCRLCERAAASAGVLRMYFGPGLEDAGRPTVTDASAVPSDRR
jgi:tRNA(Arg) A34 adenosine deaminase TadA